MHVHCCTCIYSLTYTRRVRERESREKRKERETENADQGRRDTTSSRWNVQRDDAAAALYASSDRCCNPCKDVALASREPSLSVFLFLSFILPLPRFFFFCSLLYRGFRAIRTRACGGGRIPNFGARPGDWLFPRFYEEAKNGRGERVDWILFGILWGGQESCESEWNYTRVDFFSGL